MDSCGQVILQDWYTTALSDVSISTVALQVDRGVPSATELAHGQAVLKTVTGMTEVVVGTIPMVSSCVTAIDLWLLMLGVGELAMAQAQAK